MCVVLFYFMLPESECKERAEKAITEICTYQLHMLQD